MGLDFPEEGACEGGVCVHRVLLWGGGGNHSMQGMCVRRHLFHGCADLRQDARVDVAPPEPVHLLKLLRGAFQHP